MATVWHSLRAERFQPDERSPGRLERDFLVGRAVLLARFVIAPEGAS